MSSIIYRSKTFENNLNFTAVAVGTKDTVSAFLKYAAREFNNKFNNDCVLILSDRTLDRAEGKPQLLEKSSKINIKIPLGQLNKDYYGYFINPTEDKEPLYDFLYSSADSFDCSYNNYPPYFSENTLFGLLKDHFNSASCFSANNDVSDILFHFEFEKTAPNIYMAKAQCSICANSTEESLSSYTEWCKNLIRKFDDLFCDSFHSAYVSYSPRDFAVTHSSIYTSVNKEDVRDRLLGWEWCTYVSKRIADVSDIEKLSETYKIEKLTSGAAFESKASLEQFGKEEIKATYPAIKRYLIPGIGMVNWDMLCKNSKRTYYPVKNIIVYSFPINDYFLLLPFGCTKEKIEEITGYNVNEAWKMYSLNEDFYN